MLKLQLPKTAAAVCLSDAKKTDVRCQDEPGRVDYDSGQWYSVTTYEGTPNG